MTSSYDPARRAHVSWLLTPEGRCATSVLLIRVPLEVTWVPGLLVCSGRCREGQPSQPAPRGLSGQHARRSGRRHPRPSASLPYHDVGLQRLGPPCSQGHLSFRKFLIVYFLEPRFLGCVLHTRGQGAYAERDRVPTPSPSTSPLRRGGPCEARVARLLLSFLLSASAPVTRLLLGPSSAFRPQAQSRPPDHVTRPRPAPSQPRPGRSVTSAHDGSLTDVSVPRRSVSAVSRTQGGPGFSPWSGHSAWLAVGTKYRFIE